VGELMARRRPTGAVASTRDVLTRPDTRRRLTDRVMAGVVTLAFLVALVPLVSLVWTVVANGIQRLSPYFFAVSMRGVFGGMDAGGIYHAMVGTVLVTGAAALISVPIGLLTAVYLVEYGRGRLARSVTFFVDVMTGIPSIVAGLFAYALFAVFFGPGVRFGVVGAVALSVLMIPVVVRSSEEMLRLVPEDQRAASAGLGARRWQTITRVVLPSAAPGLTTGAMLAVARAAGETAVLILTALGSLRVVNAVQGEPIASITLLVYRGARQPFEEGQQRAWAGALLLMLIVLVMTLGARFITARSRR
jgi:phosphate transport system permease protein